jgi:4-hydroxy-tetrahydrodipicolinate reductase
MSVRMAINGAAGRMGRIVIDIIVRDPEAELVAAMDAVGCPAIGKDASLLAAGAAKTGVTVTDDIDGAVSAAQVVIDFSTPQGTRALLSACALRAVPCVVGTTGLDEGVLQVVHALSRTAPVVVAPNFSVGVNTLWYLAARAVELLGPEFDIEIAEMHHRDKADAPSGTALRLLQSVARARGVDPEKAAVYGRSGRPGARTREEIGVLALRGGDVVGDHSLVLAGPGERLDLCHRAHGREVFARGAVRAAHWVVKQGAGLYDMSDVLGLPR